MMASSLAETNPLPSGKNYKQLMGEKWPGMDPSSFSYMTLQRMISKPALPAVMADSLAEMPPPIMRWYLGLVSEHISGLIDTVFIGSSCLKVFSSWNVSGSKTRQPFTAAVAKIEQSRAKAKDLISTEDSWAWISATMFPFRSYLMSVPSAPEAIKALLFKYQDTFVRCLFLPFLPLAWNLIFGVNLVMSQPLSASWGASNRVAISKTVIWLPSSYTKLSSRNKTSLSPTEYSTYLILLGNLNHLRGCPFSALKICVSWRSTCTVPSMQPVIRCLVSSSMSMLLTAALVPKEPILSPVQDSHMFTLLSAEALKKRSPSQLNFTIFIGLSWPRRMNGLITIVEIYRLQTISQVSPKNLLPGSD